MKILIDGRVLTHSFITGVQLYAKELIRMFDKLGVNYKIAYPPSRIKWIHHVWEHTLLPCKAKKYDILFCPGNVAPFWKFSSFKIVTVLHDLSFLYFPNCYASSFRIYYKKIIPKVIKLSDIIITVSKSEKRGIGKYFPYFKEKIKVIYPGVPREFQNLKIEYKKENYILYVGSFNPRKNLFRVIKAFQKISDKIPHKLLIAGGKFKIFKRIKIENTKRVEFLGHVERDYLKMLYSKCSLFVFPSLYESFGFPVLEAMASGAPVITSNVSSLPEIAGDAAILVNPYNINEIADAILKVLKDEKLSNFLIKKGYERIKMFSWEKTAEEILNVFEEVLSGK